MDTIVKRLFDNRRLDESAGTTAWHLRQDGRAFPVKVHLYSEEDDTLASQAEVAAFLIRTNSEDIDFAERTLDAWMALLIEESISYDAGEEEIDEAITKELNHLPYKLQYSLSISDLLAIHHKLNNYHDIDTLYDYTDNVKENIDKYYETMRDSINQQFCRVRYGGQYDTSAGDSEIWFRISSEGYNWANTIYEFVSDMKRRYNLSHVTICRDNESDSTETDYFYKAKDGAIYRHMPIEEFLQKEHEHSLVFESININKGVLFSMWMMLREGNTYAQVQERLARLAIYPDRDYHSYFLAKERKSCIKIIRR